MCLNVHVVDPGLTLALSAILQGNYNTDHMNL